MNEKRKKGRLKRKNVASDVVIGEGARVVKIVIVASELVPAIENVEGK